MQRRATPQQYAIDGDSVSSVLDPTRALQNAANVSPNPTENQKVASPPEQLYQPNELLAVAKVCQEYGLGRTMVYEWLGSGRLPALVVGKRGTRIRRQDVDDFIASLPKYKPLSPRSS